MQSHTGLTRPGSRSHPYWSLKTVLRSALVFFVAVICTTGAHAALLVSAGIDREAQSAGGSVLVSALLTNDGSSVETGIEISVTIPTGFNGLSEALVGGPLDTAASCATAPGSNSTCNANETLVWTVAAIAPGQAIALSFPAVITAGETAGTVYDLEFNLSQSGNPLNTSTASLVVDATPVLDISLSADNNPAPAGTQIRYTLSYGNLSSTSATNSSLEFALPADVSFVSATGGGTESSGTVTWNLGSIPSGAGAQQEVVATINAEAPGTPLPARAEINAIASSLPTQQASQSVGYIGDGSPLALSLTLGNESLQPGQQVMVDMVVSNPSPSTVFGGTVALRMPVGIAGVSESLVEGPVNTTDSCANDPGSTSSCTNNEFLLFSLGNLPAGRAITLSFPVTLVNTNPSGRSVLWSATVSDDGGALESEGVSLLLDASSNLNLAIDTSSAPAAAGQPVVYTLNYGNSNLENVASANLSLRLPENASASAITGGGVLVDDVISWDLASIPTGAIGQQSATITLPAGAADGSLHEADATLSGLLASIPSERRASATQVIGEGSALELDLSINPSPVEPGTLNLVELLATNPTESTVFGGVVRIRIPQSTNGISESFTEGPIDADASCATAPGSSSSCTLNEVFEFELNNMTPGQAIRISFPMVVTTATASGNVIPWRATISDDSGAFDVRNQTIAVVQTADLHLAIDDDIDPVGAGSSVSYILSYGNATGSSLASSELSFDLPVGATFISATGGGELNGNTVTWNLGSLLDESIARQTVVVASSAEAQAGQLLRSKATLTGTINSQPVVRRARESGYIGAGSELAMEMTVTPDPVLGGSDIAIDITINNPGTELVPGARAVLRIPVGLFSVNEDLVEGPLDADLSCATDSGSGSSCTTAEFLQWDLGNVAPGQTTELRVPTSVLSNLTEGNQISFQTTLADDSTALTTESQTIQIGEIAPAGPIAASLLPVSRSVEVGQTASAFASIVNTSVNTAFGCSIAPSTSVAATFSYQATDAATNGPIGSPDTPIDIPGGASQSFVFSFTPTAPITPTDIALIFDCTNSDPAPVFTNLNTLLLSAETNAIPDVIGLTTTTDLQVLDGTTTLFAVGSANVGSTSGITVSLDDGGSNLPLNLQICETDPATGACSGPIGPSAQLTYAAGSTASFAVFVDALGVIEFSPAINRIFIRFTDGAGIVRGATSTAVRTQ